MGWGGGGWGGLITFMSAAGWLWCYGMLRCEDVEVTSNGVGWGGMGWANNVHVGCRMAVMLRNATLWRCWSNFRDAVDATLWRCWSNFRDALDATLWRCWSNFSDALDATLWRRWSSFSDALDASHFDFNVFPILVTEYQHASLIIWNRSTRRSDTGSEQTADVKKLRMCFGNMFSKSIFSKNRVFATAKTTRS